ncbi:MAG: DUF4367 domain-containing protein [Candidatus Fimadaptatus sp.]|jgi:hypothetical protein
MADKSPKERYDEAALELAMHELLGQDAAALDALDEDARREAAALADECGERMLKLIERQMRRRSWRDSLLRNGKQVLKLAAMVVLVMNLGLTIAVATSDTMQARVMKFFMNSNESHVDIGYSGSHGDVDIPADWKVNYFPTYIPEGYDMVDYIAASGSGLIEYKNSSGQCLCIRIFNAYASTSINVEGAKRYIMPLHGAMATVLEQPYGMTDIIWQLGEYYFVVSTDESFDVALAVAESISVIQILQ